MLCDIALMEPNQRGRRVYDRFLEDGAVHLDDAALDGWLRFRSQSFGLLAGTTLPGFGKITYSLRITRLFEHGLGITEVGAINGHKELRMLSRYTHLRAADLAERLRKLVPSAASGCALAFAHSHASEFAKGRFSRPQVGLLTTRSIIHLEVAVSDTDELTILEEAKTPQ
ncbi:MAG: hypothetical protein K2Y56_24320 [Methylobacterium sp.]|uniref:hypothetical protein n=1 Tax=Methylobacterium sp. TaxID=409 RepID=UPI00345654B7|nr:hypothetical protein [Methylobacterium sp.]